jgi:hypothetical protein
MTPKAKKKIKRLLIRSTNWIGDAVMTTPAVRAIRHNFPDAHISMLAKPWVAPVFAHSPHVDDHHFRCQRPAPGHWRNNPSGQGSAGIGLMQPFCFKMPSRRP